MLSEYSQLGPGQNALGTMGFEGGGLNGQSYGLDELAQKDPPFSIGRVQYPISAPILALACSSETLVVLFAGTNANPGSSLPPRAPSLSRIDLNNPETERSIELYNAASVQAQLSQRSAGSSAGVPKQDNASPHRLFLDPSGRHVIVSTLTGENYYFFAGWDSASVKRARLLTKLRGAVITAVSWNSPLAQSSSQYARTTTSTKEILVGDSKGNIYEVVIDGAGVVADDGSSAAAALRTFSRGGLERHFKLVYSLANAAGNERTPAEEHAITGIRSEIWAATSSGVQSSNKRRAVVIATTATRIYQFIGSVPVAASNVSSAERDEGGMYDDLFKVYRDTMPKSLELPGDQQASEMHFWQASRDGAVEPPKTIAWMTGPGIYHGSLSYSSQEPGDGAIDSAQLLPYPNRTSDPVPYDGNDTISPTRPASDADLPLSMAPTQYHLVLLYADRVRVIRLLDDKIVYEEMLDIRPGERVKAMTTDMYKNTHWIYTDSSIFELIISEEDQDIWKVYLNKQAFDASLRFVKDPSQRRAVYSAQADAFFQQGRYIQAAEAYANGSRTFEEVVLRFVDQSENDALRVYLSACLEKLPRNDLTQRMMIATWLVEMFLSEINHLDDIAAAEAASDDVENYQARKMIVQEDLERFLQQHKDNLDRRTVFQLIASHGRTNILLHFADVVGDYERIVAHWISEEDWSAALLALARQNDVQLYYRYATVLMQKIPREAVDAFMRESRLEARRLLPALLPIGSQRNNATPSAIKYLNFLIFRRDIREACIHNALLCLYVSTPSEDDAELLHFLETAPTDEDTGAPYYDLDYALRICKAHHRVSACMRIYSKMELYESSVDLALQEGDLDTAKMNADLPKDDNMLRKKLWLKIAKHVVREKNDLKAAMQFLESTDLLKIEDILPFFPDFVTIDEFKDDVCEALEGYSAEIEQLRQDMETATSAAQAIRRDIENLQNRFVVVDSAAKCDTCSLPLLARQFYVFPCQHAFHADCLIKEVTQHLPPHMLRRMLDLQNQTARDAKNDPKKAAQIVGAANAETSSLEALGLVSGRKLAQASVQGLDQLRKLVLPDAIVSVIGGGIMSAVGRERTSTEAAAEYVSPTVKAKEEKMREELDRILASSCVYCDTAVASLDRPFLAAGEQEI